jgi:hypothetical protein
MIKILASISLLSISSAQAMDPPPTSAPEDFTGRSVGRYPLYQEGDSGAVKGNATVFRTKDGKYFGITCAHCVPYVGSLSCIVTQEKEHDNLYTVTSYSFIGNIKIHPLYAGNEGEAVKEDSKYDIALFTITGNPNLKYFDGEISTDDMKDNGDYNVCVTSFGPLFSKDRSSYEESVFHHLNSPLKFSKEGFFFHPFQARDFYLSFEPTQNGEFALNAGLLSGPEEVNLLSGDSGSLAVDSKGKAIALASAVGRDTAKLLQLDSSLEEMAKIEEYDAEFKYKLVEKIEQKVADCINFHRTSSGAEFYIFKLKEGLPSLEGNDYYTPLALHSDFINEYIHNIPELTQEDQKELKTIRVKKEAGVENPELVEEYLTACERLASLAEQRAKNVAGLGQHDLDLINLATSFDWGTVIYDNLPNPKSDKSSNENE